MVMGRNARQVMDEWRANDPAVQAEYERLGPRFEAIDELVAARTEAGLSQRALAALMGVAPSVVGRIESGSDSVKIDTLARAAVALGKQLSVRFVPAEKPVAVRPAAQVKARAPRTAAVRSAAKTSRSRGS